MKCSVESMRKDPNEREKNEGWCKKKGQLRLLVDSIETTPML